MQKLHLTTILIDHESKYKKTKIIDHGKTRKLITITGKKKISGIIHFSKPPKTIKHDGIELLFLGFTKSAKTTIQFHSQTLKVCPPGELKETCQIPFELLLQPPIDSYVSNHVTVSYCLRVHFISKSLSPGILTQPNDYDYEIFVKTYQPFQPYKQIKNKMKTDKVHFRTTLKSEKYDTKDILEGQVVFNQIDLGDDDEIESMTLSFLREEIINLETFHTNLFELEILDGEPFENMEIPFRILLGNLHLCPTMISKSVGSFQLQYFLFLKIKLQSMKTLFHKWEIQIYRKENIHGKESSKHSRKSSHSKTKEIEESNEKESSEKESSEKESENEIEKESNVSTTQNENQSDKSSENSSDSRKGKHSEKRIGKKVGISFEKYENFSVFNNMEPLKEIEEKDKKEKLEKKKKERKARSKSSDKNNENIDEDEFTQDERDSIEILEWEVHTEQLSKINNENAKTLKPKHQQKERTINVPSLSLELNNNQDAKGKSSQERKRPKTSRKSEQKELTINFIPSAKDDSDIHFKNFGTTEELFYLNSLLRDTSNQGNMSDLVTPRMKEFDEPVRVPSTHFNDGIELVEDSED